MGVVGGLAGGGFALFVLLDDTDEPTDDGNSDAVVEQVEQKDPPEPKQLEEGEPCEADDHCNSALCKYGECAGAFVSVWDTNPAPMPVAEYEEGSATLEGRSEDDQIRLPLDDDGDHDFTVDWGDGHQSEITGDDVDRITHTYDEPGTYTVEIRGRVDGWSFDGEGDAAKLDEIRQWGALRLGDSGGYFDGARNLEITAGDVPYLGATSDMSRAFRGCESLEKIRSIDDWDMSGIETTSAMFKDAHSFDQALDGWDTSSVTDMSEMFRRGRAFNADIGGWDTSSVTDISRMFHGARRFNVDIGEWDTSSVEDMRATFNAAASFNADIGDWDTSAVRDTGSMFRGAEEFNRDIGGWDTSSVETMAFMFAQAHAFDQNLHKWDTSNVEDMRGVFRVARAFNGDVETWDTSVAETMMHMFFGASSFDQNLGGWDVSNVEEMSGMFGHIELSTRNYDALLEGWAGRDVRRDLEFDAGNSRYSERGESHRQKLIENYGWEISDGGKTDVPPATQRLSKHRSKTTPEEICEDERGEECTCDEDAGLVLCRYHRGNALRDTIEWETPLMLILTAADDDDYALEFATAPRLHDPGTGQDGTNNYVTGFEVDQQRNTRLLMTVEVKHDTVKPPRVDDETQQFRNRWRLYETAVVIDYDTPEPRLMAMVDRAERRGEDRDRTEFERDVRLSPDGRRLLVDDEAFALDRERPVLFPLRDDPPPSGHIEPLDQ